MRKAENKAKAQHSTDIISGKLIAELDQSARLGKTFPSGWLGGKKLGKRLISANWGFVLADLGNNVFSLHHFHCYCL